MEAAGTHVELQSYWEERAHRFAWRESGLPAVCSYGMPRLYNQAMHLAQQHALRPWIERCEDADVLDVGCGVGRWSLQLAARGSRVVGVDLSPTMIDIATHRAMEAGSNCRFQMGDVAAMRLGRAFDYIFVVTVMQYITEHRVFCRAVENLARHLAPGGTLVLLEAAPRRWTSRCDAPRFRARTVTGYRVVLERFGLRLIETRGVDISPLRTALLPTMGELRGSWVRRLLTTSALLALPLNMLLARHLTGLCWHKVMVVGHQGA